MNLRESHATEWQRRQMMRITEGFRKGDKVGIGQGQRSGLRDGGELLMSSGGEDGDGGFQGLGKGRICHVWWK